MALDEDVVDIRQNLSGSLRILYAEADTIVARHLNPGFLVADRFYST